MGKHIKVNKPGGRKKLVYNTDKLSPQGQGKAARTALGIAVALIVAVWGLIALIPKLLETDPEPWTTTEKRMILDKARSEDAGKEVYIYRYAENEVSLWAEGMQRTPGEAGQIAEKAVRLLSTEDAATVLIAGIRAGEEARMRPFADRLLERVQSKSGADARLIRNRLEEALAASESEP
ncbi:MAG: hypothetical protein AAF191_17575 [Verrucomicrobiota bacterium]